MPATSPLFADVVEAARVDGPGFTATPGLSLSSREAMRAEMVRWARSLDIPADAARPEEVPPALRKALREHGYWDVAP